LRSWLSLCCWAEALQGRMTTWNAKAQVCCHLLCCGAARARHEVHPAGQVVIVLNAFCNAAATCADAAQAADLITTNQHHFTRHQTVIYLALWVYDWCYQQGILSTLTWHIAKDQLLHVQLRRILQQDVIVFCHHQVMEEAKGATLQRASRRLSSHILTYLDMATGFSYIPGVVELALRVHSRWSHDKCQASPTLISSGVLCSRRPSSPYS
jgi:hypothetical protein